MNQVGLRRVTMRKYIPQLDEAGKLLQSDRQKEKAQASYGDAPYRSFLKIGPVIGRLSKSCRQPKCRDSGWGVVAGKQVQDDAQSADSPRPRWHRLKPMKEA